MKQSVGRYFFCIGILSAVVSVGKAQSNVVTAPAGSQTISQPAGTSLDLFGNLGIGTSSPAAQLHIYNSASGGIGGHLMLDNNGGAVANATAVTFADGGAGGIRAQLEVITEGYPFAGAFSFQTGPPSAGGSLGERMRITGGGNVGIGTSAPQNYLSVAGGINVDQNDDDAGSNFPSSYNNYGISFGLSSGEGIGSARVDGSANQYGLDFYTGYYKRVSLTQSGNFGIGTAAPSAMLDVAGNVKISGSGASLTFPDGSIQSTAYTGTCTATGGDYAESIDVEGEKADYQPGDVLVLDPDSQDHFLLSSEPYSGMVAGIYSTKPGYVGRRQTISPKLATSEIPMAMVGIVPTKATTENGPIRIGDLLVTSSRPGYVMKGTDRSRMIGAVVGKAMVPLKSGDGVIEVLVSLQ